MGAVGAGGRCEGIKPHPIQEVTNYGVTAVQAESSPLLLTKTQVCKKLNIAPRTLEAMVKSRRFAIPVKIGKCAYWSEKTVETWLHRAFGAQESWRP